MRLIDADALREKMFHVAFETDSDMQKWDSGCWIRYKLFEKNLEESPTVQALSPAQPDDRIKKIAVLLEGTIDHFDREDAMDALYQIKEILK